MSYRTEFLWIQLISGSRKTINLFCALILFFGSVGFLVFGLNRYSVIWYLPFEHLKKKVYVPQPSVIPLFPQQMIVMCFYGIAGLFISCYLWSTILWSVGSGYNLFDRQKGIVRIFRWGFPGTGRRIILQFLMKEIKYLRIKVKRGFFARRVLYMEIRGEGGFPLLSTYKDIRDKEIEEEAAKLAYFLGVPIEIEEY